MTLRRILLCLAGAILIGATALAAGPRSGLLLAIGVGLGLVLEGLRFGFAGPWRQFQTTRDARGLNAQFLAIALTAMAAFPLLSAFSTELAPAHAPIGIGMLLGAFVFGAAMQVVMGCGSGTLVNAGSGNAVGLVALGGFIVGAFLGTLNARFWQGLGTLPLLSAQSVAGPYGGLALTVLALGLVAALVSARAPRGARLPQARLLLAALLLAALAIGNLVVSGQAWGIVYGLGLWGAKLAQAAGADLTQSAFWALPANSQRLEQSILTDVTSLTDLGLILGAFAVLLWRRTPGAPAAPLAARGWMGVIIAGVVLGYSSRMALGCNVGAFFSGISTGSFHGWAWFAAAFAGSSFGIRLRPYVLIAPRSAQVPA